MRIWIFRKEDLTKTMIKILVIIAIALIAMVLSRNALSVFSVPIRNIVVVIDAGHGGNDPGAIGLSGSNEADINLQIALKLRRLIEQGGGVVIMTRESDNALYTEQKHRSSTKKNEDLKNRRLLINTSQANLFISIHLNSFPQTQYYGAQTFYRSGDEKGRHLAECMQKEMIATLDKKNNRVAKPTDSVYILKGNNMPSTLIECGFLSNHHEEHLLMQDHYQEKVAWAIFCGIVRYFEEEGKQQ